MKPHLLLLLAAFSFAAATAQSHTRVDPYTSNEASFTWSDLRDIESVRPSPNSVVGLQTGFSRVMISYGSPAVRGREFGVTLARWNELWRTGANESTVFSTTEDVLIEGQLLPKGAYSLLTIPGREKWTIIFNNNPKIWNFESYDPKNNVVEIVVPHQKTEELQERLRFYFDEINTTEFSARVVVRWEYWKVGFQVKEP